MFGKKWLIGAAALVTLGAFSVACGGDDDDDDSAGSGNDAAAILGNVPAPDEAAPAGSKVFVGHDKDNKASIGLIVFSDDTAAAYACDGDKVWTWYTGEVDGNNVELAGANGAKLTAKIEGSKASGSTTGAEAVSFTIEAAAAENHAGLYRGTDTKDSNSQTSGWVIANDGVVRGGLNLTIGTTTSRLGTTLDAKRIADIEALPEFPEIKAAIPGFPVFPTNVTVFSARDKLCGRIAVKLMDQTTIASPGVPDTAANRARLGLLGRLGCQQEALFAIA